MSTLPGTIKNLNEDQENILKEFEEQVNKELNDFKQEKITIWNIQLWPIIEDSIPRKVILLKFLRARNWDKKAAIKQLINTLKWREEQNIENDEFLKESFPESFDKLGMIYGNDKENNPVVYNIYGAVDLPIVFPEGSISQFIRWRLQLMEQSLRLLDFDNNEFCTQIHDYEGATMLSFNMSVKKASRELIKIFQDYYPETLRRKYFIHVPSFFETIYNVISPLIQEETRQKFIICAGGYRTKLFEHIDIYQVPLRYGGFLESPDSKAIHSEDIMKKISISAGKKEIISIQMKKSDEIIWYISVLDKDIEFSCIWEKDNEIVKSKRVHWHHGNYIAEEDGNISLTLSNSFSYFNKKTIWYHTSINSP